MTEGAAVRCWLYTANGALLSAGRAVWPEQAPPQPDSIIAFWAEQPSRVIRYCLLERLQDVRLQTAAGTLLRAWVERVFFQVPHGRCCRLRILAVYGASLPVESLSVPSVEPEPVQPPVLAASG